MFKKVLLVALAAVAVSATAFAQAESVPLSKAEKFYQVVPKHEFTINGFGGMSTLMYKVDGSYYTEYDQQQREVLMQNPAVKSDLVNFSNGPFHPTGLGGGGGFGYIWHFHPNVGLMTGVDVAYYSGGIRNLGPSKEDEPWYPLASSYIVTEEVESNDGMVKQNLLMAYSVSDYSEMQKYLALQIPIMFQFMAPMGQGNHHFYAALGARIGFGIWNNYKGKGGELGSTYEPFRPPYTTSWSEYLGFDSGNFVPPVDLWGGPGDYNEHPEKYPWIKISEATPTSDPEFSYEPSGRWGAKLVNVMASAELGFRWNLGRSANNYGFGLYTALYADYGVLTVNKKENVALITGYDKYDRVGPTYGPYETHSVLNAQDAPYGTKEEIGSDGGATHGIPTVKYKYEPVKPLAKAHTLAAGIKLKFAFGKVTAIAPVVPILPKPDTVTKIVYVRDTVQNTVVVRDTVQNTVVVRDTVTNTVVVRDTVTIIKEIPVEIQQTMRDLSNTLFEFNKFNLGEKARGYLDEIVDWLVENPKVNVEIGGHTDGIGSQEYNQKLSENRAKTVYNYFVEHGVNKNRLSYKGYGKSEPIADNSTDAGRQQNRRVELKIINN